MIDDTEISFFVWITSVNPLLFHKRELELLVNSLTKKKARMASLLVQWIFNYYKRSQTSTKDMLEKLHKESFYLLLNKSFHWKMRLHIPLGRGINYHLSSIWGILLLFSVKWEMNHFFVFFSFVLKQILKIRQLESTAQTGRGMNSLQPCMGPVIWNTSPILQGQKHVWALQLE